MISTKTRLIAAAALSTALFAGVAQAGDVSWSIGIHAPIGYGASIGTVFSNHHMAPVVIAPAPVIYAPAPVVYVPSPVVYAPTPVVYAPPVYGPRRVAVGAPVWVGGRWFYPQPHRRHVNGWRDDRGHWDRGHWDRGDRHRPPVYAPQAGRQHHGPY